MNPLVIFGSGDIAELARFYFVHDAHREVVAFTVDDAFISSPTFSGLPLVPFQRIAETYPPDTFDLFVAISYAKINALRAQKVRESREKGYALASYLSSRATT